MTKNKISVKNLSKEFKLPHERHSSLKSTIINFRKRSFETFRALDDVSFDVKEGEFFGILGRNGSGKSTLLKLLASIYTPTEGTVTVDGNLTPFIELGVGFNPELTGHENVYLNGAILGLTQKEIEEKYTEIVEFAELERFMDQKLKNYSSGMQVRLAFSIAIQAHNAILLIDEVLAVGDERFQNKCLEVFNKIKKDPTKTVVFVSHDMGSVQRFCDRAIVIHDSKLIYEGDSAGAVYEYKKLNFPDESFDDKDEKKRWGSGELLITESTVHQVETPGNGNDLIINMKLNLKNKSISGKSVVCGIGIFSSGGINVAGPNSLSAPEPLIAENGEITYIIKNHNLNSGLYYLTTVLQDEDGKTIDHRERDTQFTIARKTSEVGVLVVGGEWKQDVSK